jgi:hypothetical protein
MYIRMFFLFTVNNTLYTFRNGKIFVKFLAQLESNIYTLLSNVPYKIITVVNEKWHRVFGM